MATGNCLPVWAYKPDSYQTQHFICESKKHRGQGYISRCLLVDVYFHHRLANDTFQKKKHHTLISNHLNPNLEFLRPRHLHEDLDIWVTLKADLMWCLEITIWEVVKLMVFLNEEHYFVNSLFFMAALNPSTSCAPTPFIYGTVNEVKQLGHQPPRSCWLPLTPCYSKHGRMLSLFGVLTWRSGIEFLVIP